MCVFMLMSIHLVLSCLDYIAMQYSCHSMCSCSLCALGYLKLVQNYLICFSCKLFDLTLCYLCNMLRNRELIFLGFGWTAVLWTLSSVSCSRLQRFYKRATCKEVQLLLRCVLLSIDMAVCLLACMFVWIWLLNWIWLWYICHVSISEVSFVDFGLCHKGHRNVLYFPDCKMLFCIRCDDVTMENCLKSMQRLKWQTDSVHPQTRMCSYAHVLSVSVDMSPLLANAC